MWWEAGSENHREVHVARPLDDAFRERVHGLVHQEQHAAVDDLLRRHGAAAGGKRLRHLSVHPLLATRVGVEPAAVLPSHAAEVRERVERGGRVHAVSEGTDHLLRHMSRDVEPDLVEEAAGAHREPEVRQCFVDRGHVRPVREQESDLVQVGGEQPIHEEAGPVRHEHNRLSEPLREPKRGRERRLRGELRADDLDERHAVDGVEEVHADDVLRTCGRSTQLGHRQRRGVRGEDGVRRHHLLRLLKDLPLQGQPLRDRLDDEIDIVELLVAEGSVDEGELETDLLWSDDAPLPRLPQQVARVPEPRVERFAVDILEDDGDVLRGHEFRDAAAHDARAENGNPVDLPRPVDDLGREGLLRRLTEPEEPYEVAADAGRRHATECLGLDLQRLAER